MARTPAPTFTVPELAATIRSALEEAFPTEVWVRGEIAGLNDNRARSGHVYFSLIEPNELGRGAAASLQVMLPADKRHAVNEVLKRAGGAVRFSDGVAIRLRARIDFYPPNGRLSLRMTMIDPDYTLGKLAADRERLLRLLAAEGLLRRQEELWLSPAPLRIGLVTSQGSAAEQDVLHELQRSGYRFEVRTFHAQVQGSVAPETVVRALEAAHRHGCELIVLVRGGGARTDLAAFDAELIARAVAALPVPVWTGIGHETDRSVADEVAQRAFKTPTACAAALVDRIEAFRRDVERRWDGIAGLAGLRLDTFDRDLERRWQTLGSVAGLRLDQAGEALERRRREVGRESRSALRMAEGGLDERRRRLGREADRVLRTAEDRLAVAHARVTAADPQRALARGFSLTRRADDGRLVRDRADVAPGDEIVTLTAGGELRSTVRADG